MIGRANCLLIMFHHETGIADITRLAHGADCSPGRVVRISGPPTLVARFLAPRLLPLQGEVPGLRIELVGEGRLDEL